MASGRGRGRPRKQEPPVPKINVEQRTLKPVQPGSLGETIDVVVNYFRVSQFPQQGFAYQYDIEIKTAAGRTPGRCNRRVAYNLWLKGFLQKDPSFDRYRIVFDNDKIIFTYDQKLPFDNIQEIVKGPNRQCRIVDYHISIKQVRSPIDLSLLRSVKQLYANNVNNDNNNIDLNALQSIRQILAIVIHEKCSSEADFIFSRSFFSQPSPADRYSGWDLGLGTAAWSGFYSCPVITNGSYSISINLDISYQAFMQRQPFIDFLCEIMRHSPLGKKQYANKDRTTKVSTGDLLNFFDIQYAGDYYQGERDFLVKHCRNLSVRSHVKEQTIGYKIKDLGESASKKTFYWNKKKCDITIADYYLEHHGFKLQYPDLPVLIMAKDQPTYVPMELIHVEPIKTIRLTEEQRAKFCNATSLAPYQTQQAIRNIRQNNSQQNFDDDPFVRAWNINVDVNMRDVTARILPMPDVICNKNNRIKHPPHSKGVWNSSRTEFYQPAHFPELWGLINLSSVMDENACISFYDELANVARNRGMNCPVPRIYEEYDAQNQSIDQILNNLYVLMNKNPTCKFLLVILPKNKSIGDKIYAAIKELCELESGFGIPTQMIKLKQNEGNSKWNYSRLHNIMMKINAKLMGINAIISVQPNIERFLSKTSQIMYVGIDLSHGPAGSKRTSSTVAVVASIDAIPTRYVKEIYLQERPMKSTHGWEYIVDMKDIMKSLIRQYKELNHYPPNAIIIYRDGISNGEFCTIFEAELTAIREACVELSTAYRPCLSYIVVNKKHHTKFMTKNSDTNIPAATCIDSDDVTSPNLYDFHSASHYAEKGTTRVPHYHVLHDDNHLEPDQMQMLTLALCFLHARCSRSISIPAPVKYADILAYRAGFYRNIHNRSSPSPSTTESTASDDTESDNQIKSTRIVLSANLQKDCPFFL